MTIEAARARRAARLLRQGIAALSAADPDLGRIAEQLGAPPSRLRPEGFETLLKIVVQQQVSLAAGEAIWGRLVAGLDGAGARAVARAEPAHLCALGMSRAKAACARALAEAVADGRLDFARLGRLDDDAAVAELTAIKGIGRWTAEIYLLTALQRPDVFPAGDVALMAAAGAVKRLAARPDRRALLLMAEAWRPWRAVAARLLWQHYRHARGREAGL